MVGHLLREASTNRSYLLRKLFFKFGEYASIVTHYAHINMSILHHKNFLSFVFFYQLHTNFLLWHLLEGSWIYSDTIL